MRATKSSAGQLVVSLANLGRASRYISRVFAVRVDGTPLDLRTAWCANSSVGEAGKRLSVTSLDRERGVYVRRGQVLELMFSEATRVPVGRQVELEFELGGVVATRLAAKIADGADSHILA